MNWKHRILGLATALLLSMAMIGLATAQTTSIGTIDVEVTVEDHGQPMAASLVGGAGAVSFGTVEANAAGPSGSGLFPATAASFDVLYEHDTLLTRPGSQVTIKLGDGTLANAFLGFQGTVPSYIVSSQVNLQIPGRYLTIEGMNNPQQLKWTGGTSSTGDIWSNSGVGRVPRVAGAGNTSGSTGKAIYKVGDIGGAFGQWTSGTSPCKITSGSSVTAWPTVCGDNSFGEAGTTASHLIANIYEGSGFVQATHTIELGLDVPAGVYPGVYEGTLTVEQIAAP